MDPIEYCTAENLISGNAEIKCEFRDGGSQKNAVKMLTPLTYKEQLAWINELVQFRKNNGTDTSVLERYIQTFQSLQKNEDIKGLLEIPILLRMIVQNYFEPSSGNRVNLYRELFDKTLFRQGLEGQRDRLHSIYREIAFRIFVYDDDCAEFNEGEFKEITGSNAYLYQYYLCTPETGGGQDRKDKYRITFLHRSFYQYFLGEFFYEKLETITDVQGGKDFLKYLWARRLDKYVLDNLRYRANNVNIACKCVLNAIEETDAILPEYENVSDSKKHVGNYDMANNVFWNAVSTCCSLFQNGSQESFDLTGRIAELLSKYDCFSIFLRLSSLSNANLRGAKLDHADLSGADLSSTILNDADLRNADLRDTYLRSAFLISADLRGALLRDADLRLADLSGADLRGADLNNAVLSNANLNDANLNITDLRGADLRNAKLNNVDLHGADLSGADLCGAKLCNANLKGADLSDTNLRDADLCDADLCDADLFETNLENTHVSKKLYTYLSRKSIKDLNKTILVDDE